MDPVVEISVGLDIERAKQDAKKLSDTIRGIGAVTYGGGAGMASRGFSDKDSERSRKERWDEIRGQRQAEAEERWEAQQERARRRMETMRPPPTLAEISARSKVPPTLEEVSRKDMQGKLEFARTIGWSAQMLNLRSPMSMIGGLANIYGAVTGTATGKAITGAIGGALGVGGTAAAVVATAGIATAAIAVTGAFAALHAVVKGVTTAMESARQLYAKQLTSGGLGSGFVTQRSNLARVLGVGEQEVWAYSKAIEAVSGRVQHSTQVFTETTRTLANVSWSFQALKLELEAFFAKVAVELAPSLDAAARAMQALVHWASEMVDKDPRYKLLNYGLRALGFGGEAPEAPNALQRIAPSSWERMGLAIGLGGNDYAMQTARNTKETASVLRQILNRGGDMGTGSAPAYSYA
jgi:uncharacterized protein (DUF697 family)